jgi:hypothetical protein
MPIRFEVDRPNKLVLATADGQISSDELRAFVADVIAAEAMAYSKLFDISNARLKDTAKLADVAINVRLYEEIIGNSGPVAIVVREGMNATNAKRFMSISATSHRIKFFTDPRAAAEWLSTRNELGNTPLH